MLCYSDTPSSAEKEREKLNLLKSLKKKKKKMERNVSWLFVVEISKYQSTAVLWSFTFFSYSENWDILSFNILYLQKFNINLFNTWTWKSVKRKRPEFYEILYFMSKLVIFFMSEIMFFPHSVIIETLANI